MDFCGICGSKNGNHETWCSLSSSESNELGDWIREGLCGDLALIERKYDNDLQAACRDCPVQLHCAEYAIEARETEGIWGGLTNRDRRKVRAGVLALEDVLW